MLRWFLPHINMNQLWVHICPLPIETTSQGDILNPILLQRPQNKDFSLRATPQTESPWMQPQESYERPMLWASVYGLPGFYR